MPPMVRSGVRTIEGILTPSMISTKASIIPMNAGLTNLPSRLRTRRPSVGRPAASGDATVPGSGTGSHSHTPYVHSSV